MRKRTMLKLLHSEIPKKSAKAWLKAWGRHYHRWKDSHKERGYFDGNRFPLHEATRAIRRNQQKQTGR